MSKKDKVDVVKKITEAAKDIYEDILKKLSPTLTMPLRSLQNVKYDQKNL